MPSVSVTVWAAARSAVAGDVVTPDTVGAVSSIVICSVAATAGLPATSDTRATSVSVPSGSICASAAVSVVDQALPVAVACRVCCTTPLASTMVRVTSWPSSRPPVVPLMTIGLAALAMLMVSLPAIGPLMAMIGGVSSTTRLCTASGAGLPAESDRSTLTL